MAHARLLRLGQPQREGDLPALPRLVRRQPRQPLAAPAGRGAARATSTRSAAPTRSSPRRRATSTTATCASPPSCSTTWCSPTTPNTHGPRACWPSVYDTLGYGAENGTWRNFYLQGAYELRNGVAGGGARRRPARPTWSARSRSTSSSTRSRSGSTGRRRGTTHLAIDWVFTDLGHTYRTELTNGVLIQDVDPKRRHRRPHAHAHQAAAARAARGCGQARRAHHRGRHRAWCGELLSFLDPVSGDFPIVTP